MSREIFLENIYLSHCLDLDLNDQKTRRYFWQWFFNHCELSDRSTFDLVFSLFSFSFNYFFLKYKIIVRSSAWSLDHSDAGPSSVLYLPPKRESHLRYTAMSLFARNLWVASMASASGLFSSQDFVIASVVNFGKDDIATILATFCFNKKKREKEK